MKIAVLGALGNYGLTICGLAMEQGHELGFVQFPGSVQRIGRQPEKNYEPTMREFERNQGKFELVYKESGQTKPYQHERRILRNTEEIPEDVEVIVLAYPSLMHEHCGRLLNGRLSGKTVITFTDRVLGGYSLLRTARALSTAKLLAVNATPVTSFKDKESPFRRIVYSRKKQIRVAPYPTTQSAELIGTLRALIPADYSLCDDVLELGFNCTPSNLHAPHDLMNLVRYERGHEFTMFHEGFTAGIEQLIGIVSQERCDIARKWGYTAASFLEYERKTYGYSGSSITENRRLNPQLNQVPAPEDIWSCKGIEDVACALVPLSEMAQRAGIPCPMIDSLITIWGGYLGADFRKQGRTLASLGLSGKTVTEIKKAMQ